MGAALLAVGIELLIGIGIGLIVTVIGLFFGNIIVFDSIALAILAGFLSHGLLGVHPALAIVIGIAVLLGLLLLHRTRPGFWLIGGVLSVVWGFVFATMAYEFSGKDMVWTYVVWALGAVLVFFPSPAGTVQNCIKGDYTEQAIRERIAGTYISSVHPKQSHSSVRMLIDIDAAMRSGKGAGYERWAKVFNVKQLAKAVAYLKEHGDMSYEDLQAKSQATTSRFNELSTQIKDMESRLSQNGELQKQIVNYSKTRTVYIEYRKSGYSKKFRAEHEADILIHQAAKKYFDSLGVEKLPTIKALREEYTEVLEAKRKAYAEYKQIREEMRELQNVKANIDYLLEPSAERTQEKEHS